MSELFTFTLAQGDTLDTFPLPNCDRTPEAGALRDTHRLSLFTMLFRGLGEVALASGVASMSQETV